jgi:hypothetical protein
MGPRRMGSALAAFVLIACAAAPTAHAYGTELSSSVSVFRFMDLDRTELADGRNKTRCAPAAARSSCTPHARLLGVHTPTRAAAGASTRCTEWAGLAPPRCSS